MTMYAYKYSDTRPSADCDFFRPIAYPQSYWPSDPESQQLLADCKAYLKTRGVTEQYYKITDNALDVYSIFDTLENAQRFMLEIQNSNTRLNKPELVDNEFVSLEAGYNSYLQYSKLRVQLQRTVSLNYVFNNSTQVAVITEQDLNGYTKNIEF